MFETGLFKSFILRAINSGLSSVAVYRLLEQPFMDEVVKAIGGLSEHLTANASQVKRFVAMLVATGLSLGLYSVTVLAGWADFPATWVGWGDLLIWLGGLTFTGSQVIHSKDLQPESE